jgi:hypothetical protein
MKPIYRGSEVRPTEKGVHTCRIHTPSNKIVSGTFGGEISIRNPNYFGAFVEASPYSMFILFGHRMAVGNVVRETSLNPIENKYIFNYYQVFKDNLYHNSTCDI